MTLPVLNSQQTDPQETEMAAVLREYRTETGRTLLELLDESPLLLIFLRHFGCSFCRQTLDDVSRIRHRLRRKGFGRSLSISERRSGPSPTLTTTIFRMSSGSAIPMLLCMPAQSFSCRGRMFFPSSWFPRYGRAGCRARFASMASA